MIGNRFIQFICVVLAACMILGSTLMAPTIDQQRIDLQLTAKIDKGEEMPAHVAILTTALGAFRGLIVDMMWYRAEMLKREGKYAEADTWAGWITTLQPRFGQVWVFRGWRREGVGLGSQQISRFNHVRRMAAGMHAFRGWRCHVLGDHDPSPVFSSFWRRD